MFGAVSTMCAALLLSSCDAISVPHIDLVSIRSVKILRSSSDLPPSDRGVQFFPVIMITFVTHTDLGQIAKPGYSIDVAVSICKGNDLDKQNPIRGYPYIYDKSGYIYSFRNISSRGLGEEMNVAYHIYLDPKETKVDYPTLPSYDLLDNTPNVCFRINGLDEGIPIVTELVAIGFHSNTVVIPKQMLVAAFAQAGLK